MKLSEQAAAFLFRHQNDFEESVLLIFYSKTKGWWGIERRIQIKLQENPFRNSTDLVTGKSEFKIYPIADSPVPIYLDREMELLVETAVIDMEKVGMYRYLSLDY